MIIENLLDRLASGNQSNELNEIRLLRLAAVQLLVGSQVDLSITLEKITYHGIQMFQADRKYLVVPGKFCSCGASEPTCKHLVAVAIRGLSPQGIPDFAEDAEKYIQEVFDY